MNENNQLVRALGLKESISMTIGTVVGVGLFTCGSAQIGSVGSWIIGFTFVALLISIWPCLIYGEMSAALPCAGGTYNYANSYNRYYIMPSCHISPYSVKSSLGIIICCSYWCR